jgi:hypothetical protein
MGVAAPAPWGGVQAGTVASVGSDKMALGPYWSGRYGQIW